MKWKWKKSDCRPGIYRRQIKFIGLSMWFRVNRCPKETAAAKNHIKVDHVHQFHTTNSTRQLWIRIQLSNRQTRLCIWFRCRHRRRRRCCCCHYAVSLIIGVSLFCSYVCAFASGSFTVWVCIAHIFANKFIFGIRNVYITTSERVLIEMHGISTSVTWQPPQSTIAFLPLLFFSLLSFALLFFCDELFFYWFLPSSYFLLQFFSSQSRFNYESEKRTSSKCGFAFANIAVSFLCVWHLVVCVCVFCFCNATFKHNLNMHSFPITNYGQHTHSHASSESRWWSVWILILCVVRCCFFFFTS